MGGMRAVEWAVSYPERTSALLLLATTAAASAEQNRLGGMQLHAIRSDPHWRGGDYHATGRGPETGLGLARRIAHVTTAASRSCRSASVVRPRRLRIPKNDGRYQVESYLGHHAAKLVRRFDAGSYVRAGGGHVRARHRAWSCGTRAALRRVTARALVAGVSSDRLYPPAQQAELAAGIDSADRLRFDRVPVRSRRFPDRGGAGWRHSYGNSSLSGATAPHRGRGPCRHAVRRVGATGHNGAAATATATPTLTGCRTTASNR